MRTSQRGFLGATVLILWARAVAAQGHEHARNVAHEQLGAVHFPTSCSGVVTPAFDRGIALLHSFEFGASMRAFNDILALDPSCAMAEWGVAMSLWTNPMANAKRAPALLVRGRQAADSARHLASSGATDRERLYIAAVAELYRDHEHVDQQVRVAAYERAMADLVAKQPADTEAKIFHALALTASASPADKSYANQLKAGAVLESIFVRQPNHPGLAHYIIHTYDVPALAPRAEVAARRYAAIAPSAAHALHMPSHTFTQIGMWEASAATNRRSIEAARKDNAIAEALHASDYAEYAYLQMRRDSAARAIVRTLPALAARFDPTAITGAAPGWVGVFALAAIPARNALERRAWTEAATLEARPSAFPWTEAMTYFARSLGASHLGDTVKARVSIDSVAVLQERERAAGEGYWTEQVAIQRLVAQAWLDHAERRDESAVANLREAARREDATEKSSATPGLLAPAHEQLGDLLMELGRKPDALAEYRAALEREPNRHLALEGALRASSAIGDRKAEASYRAQLARLVGQRAASPAH